VTTAIACAAAHAAGAPWPATLGIALGGFLIDVDHAVDYVLVERQRDLRPAAFLRYYVEGRVRRTVLVLHAWELLALLAVVAGWTGSAALTGYLLGAGMHLLLDVLFNGELTPRSILAFYSVAYRATHGFDTERLLAPSFAPAPEGFWAAFFLGARRADARRAVAAGVARAAAPARGGEAAGGVRVPASPPSLPSGRPPSAAREPLDAS